VRAVTDLSSDSFSATLEHLDGHAVIALRGELDMDSAPQLTEFLGPFLNDGPAEILLDLSGLCFVDSSGLSVLVAAQTTLNSQERHLIVRSVHSSPRRVFEITGVSEFLNVDLELELPTPHLD
jgi:anti-sigma B factor antagonist